MSKLKTLQKTIKTVKKTIKALRKARGISEIPRIKPMQLEPIPSILEQIQRSIIGDYFL